MVYAVENTCAGEMVEPRSGVVACYVTVRKQVEMGVKVQGSLAVNRQLKKGTVAVVKLMTQVASSAAEVVKLWFQWD